MPTNNGGDDDSGGAERPGAAGGWGKGRKIYEVGVKGRRREGIALPAQVGPAGKRDETRRRALKLEGHTKGKMGYMRLVIVGNSDHLFNLIG